MFKLSLMTACLVLFSCGETSSARRCEPVPGSGCDDSQRCVVGTDGAPACVSVGAEKAEGELCEVVDDCANGMGCVRIFGVPRCLRFCEPPTETDDDACRAAVAQTPEDKLHRFSDSGRCVASLPDRPDIGVCVLPCEPGVEDADCPSCGLVVGLGMATCTEPGESLAGESCGVVGPCAANLFCEPNASTCRVPAGEDGCAEGEGRAETIAGMRDPITFRDYAVCVPE